jgi:hypothetical protein
MTKTATKRKQLKSASSGAASRAVGWLRQRFQRLPKARLKVGKRKQVIAHIGDTEKQRINLGGIIARVALTALAAEVFILVARPQVAQPAIDGSCRLRQWTGNPVVDNHWQDIRRWCPAIMQAGDTYHLDPYLIATLILQESGGHPDVVSRSGAVGLMQVMPRDGLAAGFQCVSGPCFASRPSIDELKDPAFNIDYGARLLAANEARTGSMREALRSYGPNNVGYTYADGILRIYEMIR